MSRDFEAVYEAFREKGVIKEGLLCAWAILREGRKVLLHLEVASKESYAACLEFVRGMVKRGLACADQRDDRRSTRAHQGHAGLFP